MGDSDTQSRTGCGGGERRKTNTNGVSKIKDRNPNGVSKRVSSNVYREVVNLETTERMMRNMAEDNYLREIVCGRSEMALSPLLPLISHISFPHGPVHPGLASFPRLAHGTCSLELPGPGYSQAPPNSDRPSELPGLHGQTVWAPPALAVQLGCWGQRRQLDMQPGERKV